MKKILFVTNTMGRAGAETALLEVFKKLDRPGYEIFLYVLMEQGELFDLLPPHIQLLNSRWSNLSVFSKKGRLRMLKTISFAFLRNGRCFRKLSSAFKVFFMMARDGRVDFSKVLWRMVAEGSERFEQGFDLAVAWLEGGSAYYVADYVKAHRKTAFIHIDYKSAGYNRMMDQDCWKHFHHIFAVSNGVKQCFQMFYPEYASKVDVFNNPINAEFIHCRSKEQVVFKDDYDGMRILTVGRLVYQKGFDIAVESMKFLKEWGYQVRWYVLGEGIERRNLEKKIKALGLEKDFLLLGTVENPYPYYIQTDIYVHTARYEGKSIAIQEAQILGCPIIASDCSSNREQIQDDEDGMLCRLEPVEIAKSIEELIKDEEKRKRIGRMAKAKKIPQDTQIEILLGLSAFEE